MKGREPEEAKRRRKRHRWAGSALEAVQAGGTRVSKVRVAKGTSPAEDARSCAAQLVSAGEDGGSWGGVPGPAGTLVYSAVEENFRPGCERGDHAVRAVRVETETGLRDVH
jgi:hypothetical protein